jgi:hypothetical protein
MGDALARREPPHLALPVLADFAAAFTQDFFFLKNGFASFEESVSSSNIGAVGHRVDLRRWNAVIKCRDSCLER